MMVLGIDPGARASGWALLDFSILMAPVWIGAGTTDDVAELFELRHFVRMAIEHFDARRNLLVVVEEARGRVYAERGGGAHLIASSWAGGDAHGFARGRGYPTIKLGVNEWRTAFVGHSKRGDNVDHKVEASLRAFVRGMPTRTNVHMRDAAGVACVGARDYRQVVPPQGGYGGTSSEPCQASRRASEAADWKDVRVTVAGMRVEPLSAKTYEGPWPDKPTSR